MFRRVRSWFRPEEQKNRRSFRRRNTSVISVISNNQETTETNEIAEIEVLQMNDEQRRLVKLSWAAINSGIGRSLCYVSENRSTENEILHRGPAESFFILFETFPQSIEFFGDLRSKSIEDLTQNVKLASALQDHAVRVLQVVEKVVARIDDLEKTKSFLLELGRFHRYAGVPSGYFGVMGTIFLHATRPYLEKYNYFNEETEDAWLTLFAFIARVLEHGHTHFFTAPPSVSL